MNISHIRKNHCGLYTAIKKRKLDHFFDKVGISYTPKKIPFGYWNDKQKCLDDAAKYKTPSEWRINSKSAVVSAKRNGWFESCTIHMKSRLAVSDYYIFKEVFVINSVGRGYRSDLSNKRKNDSAVAVATKFNVSTSYVKQILKIGDTNTSYLEDIDNNKISINKAYFKCKNTRKK